MAAWQLKSRQQLTVHNCPGRRKITSTSPGWMASDQNQVNYARIRDILQVKSNFNEPELGASPVASQTVWRPEENWSNTLHTLIAHVQIANAYTDYAISKERWTGQNSTLLQLLRWRNHLFNFFFFFFFHSKTYLYTEIQYDIKHLSIVFFFPYLLTTVLLSRQKKVLPQINDQVCLDCMTCVHETYSS